MTLAGRLDAHRWIRTAGIELASQSLLESQLVQSPGSRSGISSVLVSFLDLELWGPTSCTPNGSLWLEAQTASLVVLVMARSQACGVLGFPGLVLSPGPDGR